MRKHWLLFSQTVTIALALLFIIHTLKPELLPTAARSGVVTLYENTTPESKESKRPGSDSFGHYLGSGNALSKHLKLAHLPTLKYTDQYESC